MVRLPCTDVENIILVTCFKYPKWELHRKKRFRCFPFPSGDVTYQTLSRREYVSLIKPEVFPFPGWDSHRILLNQLVFLFTDRSFPDIPLLQAGILPRSLITRLCTCVPSLKFSRIFPFWAVFPYLHKLCMGKLYSYLINHHRAITKTSICYLVQYMCTLSTMKR
jgi:hypothetical protein